jgi:hypothetical protein
MAQDYKQANDRSIADVNRMNRDAWQSGDFRHVDDLPKGAEGPADPHWKLTVSAKKGQELIGSGGKTATSHYVKRSHANRIARESRLEGGESPESQQKTRIQAVEPIPVKRNKYGSHDPIGGKGRKRYYGDGDVETDNAIPPGFTNYNQKSTTAAKRAGQVTSSSEDVRHPPEGGQEIVSRGQVVGHHDKEDLNKPEKHAKRAELRERGEMQERKAEKNWRGVTGAHKPIGGLSGISAGTHFPRQIERKKNSAESRLTALNNLGGNYLIGKSNSSLNSPSLEKKQSDRAVHLPRTAKKTWRKQVWS